MRHFNEETIIKYSLEILDDDESKKVREHLNECEVCLATLKSIAKQNKLITGYNPQIESIFIPVSKLKSNNLTWLKRAAIIIVGFVLGYAVSIIFQPEKVVVVEQFSISKSPYNYSTTFSICPSVDIYRGRIDL